MECDSKWGARAALIAVLRELDEHREMAYKKRIKIDSKAENPMPYLLAVEKLMTLDIAIDAVMDVGRSLGIDLPDRDQ